MDLKTFIAESLVQIAQGIETANESLRNSTASVNPPGISGLSKTDLKFFGYVSDSEPQPSYRIVQELAFDVAVHAVEGTETKGGIGLTVGAIALGSQGKSQNENSSESRLKFTIPMILPSPTAP